MVLEGVIWVDPMGGSRASPEPWGEGVRRLAVSRGFGVGERDTDVQGLRISSFFGGVHAVARDADGWAPAADPRRDGVGRVLSDEDVVARTAGPARGAGSHRSGVTTLAGPAIKTRGVAPVGSPQK